MTLHVAGNGLIFSSASILHEVCFRRLSGMCLVRHFSDVWASDFCVFYRPVFLPPGYLLSFPSIA